MKRIVILNGAPKKNGRTASLVKAFADGAKAAGNDVTEFYLFGMNIRGCLDCEGCARKPADDPHPCAQKDDMNLIYDDYVDADVVVFASPVYWFTITGTLKTAVDRLYAIERSRGFGAVKKDTVLLMTAGAPVYDMPLGWYRFFGTMGWRDLGTVLGAGKEAEARRLGESIC